MSILKKAIFWLNTPYDIREYHVTGIWLFLNWTKNLLKLLIWLILVFPIGWVIVTIGKGVGLIKYDDSVVFVYLLVLLSAIVGIIVTEYQIKDRKKQNKRLQK